MGLGVGIIGVDPDRGWARESHVPAVSRLDGLDLVAVGSRRAERAERAAAASGAARGYGDPLALIDDPAVDVVGVAASVPAHRELILAAARAGKHVYCEWPLAVGVAEAEEIAAATAVAGVRTAIGVQARAHPATTAAARLIAAGRVGRVLSVSVRSTTAGFGPVVPAGEWYLEDPATGMHLSTIQALHTLDLVEAVVGEWESVIAQCDVQFPELEVGEERRRERRVLPDHVLVTGRARGVPVGVEVVGGRPVTDTPFALTVAGERGTVALTGGAPRGFQAGTLELAVDGEPVPVAAGELDGLPAPVVGVAGTWAALRDAITTGEAVPADFARACRLARLVETLRLSDTEGRRVAVAPDGGPA